MNRPSALLGLALLIAPFALAQGTLPSHPAAPIQIGLALDLGGKTDGGLGQPAWEGAQRAERDFGVSIQIFTPQVVKGAVVRGSEPLAKDGAALVIAVGDANTSSLEKAAGKYPSTRFALVDDLPKGANTAGLIFSENQGSFLVGYIAAQASSTGVLGFVGGQDTPSTHDLEDGYAAGVHFLCPKCRVVSAYIGSTSTAWNDPAKGAALTVSLQTQGADVVYAAAGKSNAGVVKQVNSAQCLKATSLPAGVHFLQNPYAKVPRSAEYTRACDGDARPTFFIGVDTDQNALGDDDQNVTTLNHGLTSSVYRVDNAVYSVIRDFVKGKLWQSGKRDFGLKNAGVTYALDEYNRALISPELESRLKQIVRLVGDGTIKMPSEK